MVKDNDVGGRKGTASSLTSTQELVEYLGKVFKKERETP